MGRNGCCQVRGAALAAAIYAPGKKRMFHWGEQGRIIVFRLARHHSLVSSPRGRPVARKGPLASLLPSLLHSRPVPGRCNPRRVRR